MLCLTALILTAQNPPAALTVPERLAVMELLAAKYAADSDEADTRAKLDQMAQQQLGESRKRREAAIRAVEDKILELATQRKADPKAWLLDVKTGGWKKRETPADARSQGQAAVPASTVPAPAPAAAKSQ